MEDQNMAVNEESGAETAPVTTPVAEEQTGGESIQPTDGAEPTGEATTEEKVAEPSKKGANARIGELSKRAKEAEAKAETLAKKVEQLEAASQGFDMNQFNAPSIQPGQEVTPEQYEADVRAKAMQAALLITKQQQNIVRVKDEIKEAISKNPELDPESDKFDPDLSDSISDAVESYIRANPLGNVKAYIAKQMKPYHRSIERAAGEQTKELAKQVSERATRPTAHQGGEKPFEDLSIAEMEARLGKVY